MNIVYLNGEFIHKQHATVSIFDRGLLFADSVYEVIPFIDGSAIGADPHIDRLNRSLQSISIKPEISHTEWQNIFKTLQQKNQQQQRNHCIYLQVTRGSTGDRKHAIPQQVTPTVFAFCMPLSTIDSKKGYKAITLEDTRHDLCEIKSTNLLSNILLYQQAQQQGAIDAILHRNRRIVECTSSNVFSVHQGIIYTPPLTKYMLAGITRAFTLDAIQQLQLPFKQEAVDLKQLKQAEEIWITSSSKSILPITTLDDQPVGNGNIGDIAKSLQKQLTTA